MTSNGEIQSLLECPVCLHGMYPPIHQCSNGHALCLDCLARVHNRCPLCREELGKIRCLALENLSELVELPCRFQNWGCQESFTCQDRLEHERDCTFRPYSCPYARTGCSMENSDIQSIIAHLKRDHVIDLRDRCTFKLTCVVPVHMTWISALMYRPMLVFDCFSQHFCLHFEPIPSGVIRSTCLIFLRLMGEDCRAMRFRYSVKVNGNGSFIGKEFRVVFVKVTRLFERLCRGSSSIGIYQTSLHLKIGHWRRLQCPYVYGKRNRLKFRIVQDREM